METWLLMFQEFFSNTGDTELEQQKLTDYLNI